MHLKKVTINHERFPTKEAYPFSLPIFQRPTTLEFRSPLTFFSGENGTGKSTLLTALCRKCNIHIWEGTSMARCEVNSYEQTFHHALDIEWKENSVPGSFFSPELFRHFSHLVDEWASNSPGLIDYFGGKSLVTQSHGQSCMSFFKSRYSIEGVHFLDEPEAALSPKSQLVLRDILTDMSAAGHAQFIISSHSPILMSCANAELYDFNNEFIQQVEYDQTEHYKIYKNFFTSDH